MRRFRFLLAAAIAVCSAWRPSGRRTDHAQDEHLARQGFAATASRSTRSPVKSRARTGGRYRIQNFYSAALGAERESVEGLQLGTLDLTMTSTGPVPNFVPEVAIFDIPFLFRDYAQARAVLDGPIGQEMLKKFEPKGIEALAWGENGFRQHDQQQAPDPDPRRTSRA